MSAAPVWTEELLQYWFEQLGPDDWFSQSSTVDDECKTRFGEVLETCASQQPAEFLTDQTIAQAAIILFDQMPRNIHRGTAQAFAYDPLAQQLAKAFIANGWDSDLPNEQRQFVAMPLMHSEELADQEASVAYFSQHLPDNASFAKSHHEMIARFGRFPHRNQVLGRETTEAEQQAIDEGFSW